MIERLAKFLRKYNLTDKTIIVGFSGGFDSMCLLDMLSVLSEQDEFINMNIIAAHFNHNWRGNESRAEQEVCRIFAQTKGIEFYTKTAPEPVKKTENDARIARYEFFVDALDCFDADAVFTAHNKDDNAETILYRVTKGTGLVGLKGIAERRDVFYRPLLKCSRKEIEEYCKSFCLTPNMDSSNSNTIYNRNYIRHTIIPALESINPSVKEALNTLSEVAASENDIIEEYLATFRHKIYNGDAIISQEFIKLSKPVKMRILHEFIQKFDLDYDYKKIKELYDFIEENIVKRNGNTKTLATALWLYVDDKIIETIPHKKEELPEIIDIDIYGEGDTTVNGKTFTIKRYVESDIFLFPESTSNFVYVDLSEVTFPLKLRTRKDGDIINPFGMEGSMKLKKYLNSKGISRHNRDSVLLLANEEEVLWVVGVGLSNKIGVKTKPTHVIELKA